MTQDPLKPTLPRTAVRVAIAVAGSLCAHVLLVSGAMRGFGDMFRWTGPAEPVPLQVRARLAEAISPPAAPAPAAPARKKPATDAARPASAPVPVPVPASTAVAEAVLPASPPPEPPPAPSIPPANEPAPPPPPPALPPAAAARLEKAIPLPARAIIAIELTREADNLKVSGTQRWEINDGKYRVTLSASLLGNSITFESRGAVSPEGLRPERYTDERNTWFNKSGTRVVFSANEKSAQVEESNGNRKSLAIAGQAADIMSLTYDLAFNPDINVGAPFTLANRDNLEEIRLVSKGEDDTLNAGIPGKTRFYDFRRPDGTGGIKVWLSPENGWLPARIRIQGRDGVVNIVTTGYEINAPDSR